MSEEYIIREAEDHETPIIVSFLQNHFYTKEYLLSSYLIKNEKKITKEERELLFDDLRRRHEVMVANMTCLVALHAQIQKIVGINLLYIDENPKLIPLNSDSKVKSFDELAESTPIRSKFLDEWISCVLHKADEQINIFDRYPTAKRALDLVIVCVDENHGGKGLATSLIREGINWAKQKNVELAHGMFTSPFSKRAAEKNGFKTIIEISTLSFRDWDDNVMYDGLDENRIHMMVKTI